jgi:Protein of unknown function
VAEPSSGEMIPAAELDRLLMSFCTERLQKVARVIGKTYEVLEARRMMFPGIAEQVDARMAALVGSGELEAKGYVKRWGYSEVRLPGERGGAAR